MTGTIRAHLERAMRKLPKDDPRVEYTSGKPEHHCGPAKDWPDNYCEHFEKPDACSKVSGVIAPHGGCKLFEKA